MGATGTVEVNFGAFPGVSDASVVITGQAGILAGSLVEAWIFPADTADHKGDEHVVETLRVMAGSVVAGTGFTIYMVNTGTLSEPLTTPSPSRFRSVAGTVYGQPGPSKGGRGTLIYGRWSVAWVWN